MCISTQISSVTISNSKICLTWFLMPSTGLSLTTQIHNFPLQHLIKYYVNVICTYTIQVSLTVKQCLNIFTQYFWKSNFMYSQCSAYQRNSLQNIIGWNGSQVTQVDKKYQEYTELVSMDECYTTGSWTEALILLAAWHYSMTWWIFL